MSDYKAKNDGGFEYRSLFWPILLIAAGVVWLLSNNGIISGEQISVLSRVWPLLLVGIGLDILIARRSPALSALIGLGTAGLIIILLLVGPGLGLAGDFSFNFHIGNGVQVDASGVQTRSLEAPAEGVEAATVSISVPMEHATITALPSGAANAFEADVEYVDDLSYSADGQNGRLDIRLRENVLNKTYVGADPLEWDVRLNPDIPTDLELHLSSGSIDAELGALELTRLVLDASSGSLEANLPESDRPFDGTIDLSSGEIAVIVPDGSGVNLTQIEGSSGSVTGSVGDGVAFTTAIDVSSGSVVIDVPDGAAVQVNADRVSSGSVSVPGGYIRTAGQPDDDEGTWESEGFSAADRPIVLNIEVSSGSVTVR